MTTRNKTIAIVGVLMFVGASLAWHHSQHLLHQHRWTVLEESIRLEDGFSVSRPFTVDTPAKYWIEIECRRTIPFDILEQTLTKNLAAEYAVTDGENRIVSGDTSEVMGTGASSEFLSRYLASFEATPGVLYNLSLRVTAGLPVIASTRPVVKVSVDSLVFMRAFVPASLWAHAALSFNVIGFVCFSLVAWALVRRSAKA